MSLDSWLNCVEMAEWIHLVFGRRLTTGRGYTVLLGVWSLEVFITYWCYLR